MDRARNIMLNKRQTLQANIVQFHFCETAGNFPEQASSRKQKAEEQLSGAGKSRKEGRLLMGTRVSFLSFYFFLTVVMKMFWN